MILTDDHTKNLRLHSIMVDLKAENVELRADIREIRPLLYKNVVETEKNE